VTRVSGDPPARSEANQWQITLFGVLTDEMRKRLFEIADRCPVHQTLARGILVETRSWEVTADTEKPFRGPLLIIGPSASRKWA